MKRICCLLLFISPQSFSQKIDTTAAYSYILDYQVPQSPAFTVLGTNPTQIVRGSAAKPLVVNLLTEFIQSGKIQPGVAIDFSPFFLFGGQFKNINDYRDNDKNRLLANTQLSIAALKNKTDSSSADIGVGMRFTFWDDHDLLNNSALTRGISEILSGNANAGTNFSDEDVIGDNKEIMSLKNFYALAYSEMRKHKGSALSAGYGFRSTAKNSYLAQDSLTNIEHSVWVAFSAYSIINGIDLLANFQGKYAEGQLPANKAGIALVSQNKNNNVGAEFVYDFVNEKFEGGLLSEFRLLGNLSALVGMSAITDITVTGKPLRLKVNTSLKWNLMGKS